MPDPLVTLARLGRLKTEEARRRLSERLDALGAAEARQAAAQEALAAEADQARSGEVSEAPVPVGAYAAWLPRGLAERDRAAAALRLQAGRAEAAREALAGSRAEERAVELLREARAAERRRIEARRTSETLADFLAHRRS